MINNKVKPELMQYAEPEYMCKCGYKFFAYPEDWKPNYCAFCGEKFDWSDYVFESK